MRLFRGHYGFRYLRVMNKLLQWLIDHPGEVFRSISLILEIVARHKRRRKKKSQEEDPGSPNNETCVPLPIPDQPEVSKPD
jgi:hypothetical protein